MQLPFTRRPDPADWPARVQQAHAKLTRIGHVDPVVAVSTPPAGRVVEGDAHQRAEIGSVTKVFTGLLLARLAELGVVRMTDTVGELLPEGTPLGEGVAQVTLESLACHRSGLPRLPPGLMLGSLTIGGRVDPYAGMSQSRLMQALADTTVKDHAGGARVSYSNYGAGLLGHLLGRATGTGYQAALTEHVLTPLGIADTSDFSDRDLRPGRARGKVVPPWHLAELAGAGALRSTAADLLTFCETVRDGTGELAGAIAETLRPRGSQGRMEVGLGWFLLGGGDLLMHNGGTRGARSEVRVERHSGTCVVVLGDWRRGTAAAATALLDPLPRGGGATPDASD